MQLTIALNIAVITESPALVSLKRVGPILAKWAIIAEKLKFFLTTLLSRLIFRKKKILNSGD